jgi:hypothetical protein
MPCWKHSSRAFFVQGTYFFDNGEPLKSARVLREIPIVKIFGILLLQQQKKITMFIIIVLSSLLLLSSCTAVAQEQPQKVYSIVQEHHEQDWYIRQHQLWKEALANNPNNPDGWLSYYTATRMAKVLERDNNRRNEWAAKMDALVNAMQQAISADTYEYHFIQGYHELNPYKQMPHIFKAYEIDPERTEVYDDLVTYYELTGDQKKLKEISKKWMASGDYSLGIMLANYNTLACTAADAILLTYGDNDTYPAWLLQQVEDFRTDVKVVNVNLMQLPDYRAAVFKELNIPNMETAKSSKEVVDHLIKHRGARPLYTSLGVPHEKWALGDKLFNVGMALVYCETDQQNLSHLVHNYEHNMLLDHLKSAVYPETQPSAALWFNKAYVPSLLMLYRHYSIIDNERERQKLRRLLVYLTKDWKEHQDILAELETYEAGNPSK